MKSVLLVFLMVFCGGCTTLVKMPQRYPSEYAALTPAQAIEDVEKCCRATDQATGLLGNMHGGVNPEGIAVIGHHRVFDSGSAESGGWYHMEHNEPVTWRFDKLHSVFSDRGTFQIYFENRPRGDYWVNLEWREQNWPYWTTMYFQVSKEDYPQFLLALSKLAPQAKIYSLCPRDLK